MFCMSDDDNNSDLESRDPNTCTYSAKKILSEQWNIAIGIAQLAIPTFHTERTVIKCNRIILLDS